MSRRRFREYGWYSFTCLKCRSTYGFRCHGKGVECPDCKGPMATIMKEPYAKTGFIHQYWTSKYPNGQTD